MCVCVCLCVFTQQNCLSAKINQPTATPWGWGSSRRDHDLREASLALLRAAVPSSMATVAQTTGSCPATTGVPDFKSFLNFSRDCSMVTEKKKLAEAQEDCWGCGVSGVLWTSPAGQHVVGARELCLASPTWQRDSVLYCHQSLDDLYCFARQRQVSNHTKPWLFTAKSALPGDRQKCTSVERMKSISCMEDVLNHL